VKFFLPITGFFMSVALFGQEKVVASDPGPLLEPDPVPFTFDAPGWFFLAGIFFISVVAYSIAWLKRYRQNAYRRAATKRIKALTRQSQSSTEITLNELMILLRNVAMQTYGRQTVASLSGKDWFSYLESKGSKTPFTDFEMMIYASVYRGKPVEKKAIEEIVQLSKRWIKTHA
jgi:hypothetical protein